MGVAEASSSSKNLISESASASESLESTVTSGTRETGSSSSYEDEEEPLPDRPWPPIVIEAPDWPSVDKKSYDADIEISPFRRMFYYGPVVAILIIIYISAATTKCFIDLYDLFIPLDFLLFSIFLMWNYLTMSNLFNAAVLGPGYVPKGWTPPQVDQRRLLQFCKVCNGYKAPRSHHCSKCGRCCMKMDHHCPWINNCVGHRNHLSFMKFLLFAIIGCIHALYIQVIYVYHAINLGWYLKFGDGTEPLVRATLTTIIILLIASALAAGVVCGLSFLLGAQINYTRKNMTGIEEYIDCKARARFEEEGINPKRWLYPYNLGWKRNIREVVTWVGFPKGNGMWWPVVEGCDQFSLTVEQLAQKAAKRECAFHVLIDKDFSGARCGSCRFGVKAFFCQPLFDGSPIKVAQGEFWTVTRRSRHWVYGYRENSPLNKGWFPIKCCGLVDRSRNTKEKKDG